MTKKSMLFALIACALGLAPNRTAAACPWSSVQEGEQPLNDGAEKEDQVKEGDGKNEEEEKEGAKNADEEEDEVKKEDEFFAAVGGDIHTGTGAVLRGATLLAKNGVIEEIGYDLVLPEKTVQLDLMGYSVYPGLVAADSQDLFGTAKDFADSIDPFNFRMVLALAAGITTASQSGAAVKLKRGEIEGVVLQEKFLTTQSWTNSNPAGKRSMREKLKRAAEYLREYRDWEEAKKDDKELKEPDKQGVDTTALKILRGENLPKFSSSERSELLGLARLAQEFRFRPVIIGCTEGWTVAGELGRAGAYAVVTPRTREDKDEAVVRAGGSSIENAAILHSAGVQVAIVPATKGVNLSGIVGRDLLHLPMEAGFAIRGGLPEDAALQAITVVPARILGIDHRVGTLEVGKDCDLIATDGDVLHYETFVQYTVVEGKVVYDKQKELFYAHIRPRPVADTPDENEPESEQELQDPEGEDPKTEDIGEDADGS